MKLKRLIAIFIDYYVILFVGFLLAFIVVTTGQALNISNIEFSIDLIINRITMPISIIGLLLKDLIFKNKSLGKKIMKIEVKKKNGQLPTSMELVLRNIFYIIWPIEFVILIICNQRIGDIILNTSVCNINK